MIPLTRTVYGLYYPETRAIVDALWASRPHEWYERNYTSRQDPMHRPCLERWRAWAGAAGVTLGSSFTFEYPTAGASEAIHAWLALAATRGSRRVHVFEGEYEGYAHVARALALDVVTHPRDPDRYPDTLAAAAHRGDSFWISQPSGIDGNLWAGFDRFCDVLAERAPGTDLVVDLTYVGAVSVEAPIDLDRPIVAAVVWSLSKPFGVYYHRVGGIVSRTELVTLRGHHWFKNLFSLHLGERLMATHPASELPLRYRARQIEAIALGRADGSLPEATLPSDVVILAHAPKGADAFAEYARGDALRFCLTPALDGMIST